MHLKKRLISEIITVTQVTYLHLIKSGPLSSPIYLVRSPRRWSVKPCMAGKPPPPSSQPTLQEWTVYLDWFCPVKHSPNPQTTSSTWPILLFWGITEPFVLWDKMIESGGLIRLLIEVLMSWSQHVSLSRRESSKARKLPISPLKRWQFSWLEHSGLPHSARMQNVEKFHCVPK